MTKLLKRILTAGIAVFASALLFSACGGTAAYPYDDQASTAFGDGQNYNFSVSASTVQMDKSTGFTTSLNVTSTYPMSVWYDIEDSDVVRCEWGNWNGYVIPLNFIGKSNGTTKVHVYVAENGGSYNAVETVTVTVTVNGMDTTGSKGLSYSAYGDGYKVSIGKCTDADIIIPATYNGRPVTAISDHAFSMKSGIKSVIIPDGVTTIGENAFFKCNDLTKVIIPNSVTSMGDAIFWGCSKLTTVNIPNGITEIGEYTFADCESLTEIKVTESVTKIGESAFSGCTNLERVVLPDALQYIGDHSFSECKALTEINFPSGLRSIGERAFYECTGIKLLKTGDKLKTIGDSAFIGCRNLTTVILSDSVETVGDMAFWECPRLSNLYLGSGLTDIYYSAFSGCKSLTHAFYNGTASQWKKVINEGLDCDVYIGEQPVGDIVDVEDRMEKILVLTGSYNGTMYFKGQFKSIYKYESISEYRFAIDVYDMNGDMAYTYTYNVAADGTDSLNRLFAMPHCGSAKGYEAIVSRISIIYNDGSAELAFTDYAKTISLGVVLDNVDESNIVNPVNSITYN